VNSNLPLR